MINPGQFTKEEVFRSGVLYSGSITAGRILAAINLFVIIFFLTIYEYGVFRLILSLVGVFQSFVLSGLDGVIRNDLAINLKNDRRQQAAQVFFEFFFVKFALAVLVWLVLFFFIVGFTPAYYDDNFISILKVASFLIILNFFSDIFSIYYKGVGRIDFLSRVNPILESIKIFILLGVFYIFGPSIQALIWSMVLTQVLSQIVYFYFSNDDLADWWSRYTWRFPNSVYDSVKSYGKWSIFSNILSDLVTNSRNYFIKFLLTTEAVAIYSLARSMIDSLNQILTSNKILMIFLPYKIAKDDLKERYYRLGVKYATYVYILLAGVGGVGGTVVIKLFFPEYITSLPIFYIMLFSFIAFGLSDFVNSYLYVLRQQKALFFRTAFKSLLVVTLTFGLVPVLGIYGLGVEYLVTNIILTVTFYLFLRNKYPTLSIGRRDLVLTSQEVKSILSRIKILLLSKR